MKAKIVEDYIVNELGKQPRHNLYSLADAITDIAEEQDIDEGKLMRLLLANEPVGMSHSYGFHTRWGRFIIEETQERYYEYEGNY
tara:strand:+ start:341 stop:595 length:255 start_codon:yes stop_codon:yes gene_type:complete